MNTHDAPEVCVWMQKRFRNAWDMITHHNRNGTAIRLVRKEFVASGDVKERIDSYDAVRVAYSTKHALRIVAAEAQHLTGGI